ncbi:hypothetical protein BGX30_008685 [Mortierella sp. GBA39]|nr:hypothetical protein BGX30_008685 [Mortierella sp. GBA39]
MTRPAIGGITDSYRDQDDENHALTYNDEDHHHSYHQQATTTTTTTTTRAASEFVVYQDPEEPQPQPQRRRPTIQRGHQRFQQQQQQQQAHPGDMSGVDLYDGDEAGLEGGENDGMEYCSDQENMQPTRRAEEGRAGSSTATGSAGAGAGAGVPAVPVRATVVGGIGSGATAVLAPAMDARQELMQRNKHTSSSQMQQQPQQLQQRRSSANIELAGRSRASIQQQQQQQSGASAAGGSYREIPGAPGRKRTRDGDGEAAGFLVDQASGDGGSASVSSQDVERHHQAKRHLAAVRRQNEYETAQSLATAKAQVQVQSQEPPAVPLTQQQLLEKQQRDAVLRRQRRAHAEEVRQYNKLIEHIDYGQVYEDDTYEYRNVTLPKVMLRYLPRNLMDRPDDKNSHVLRLLKDTEWRHIGIKMSQYWVHYLSHAPEPHVLLFRRPVGTGVRLKQEQAQKAATEKAAAAAAAAKETQRALLQRTGSSSSSSSSSHQHQQQRLDTRSATSSGTTSRSVGDSRQQSSSSGSSRVAEVAAAAEATQENGSRRSRETTPPPAPKRSNANKPRE